MNKTEILEAKNRLIQIAQDADISMLQDIVDCLIEPCEIAIERLKKEHS